jgi:hypothetical protein
VRVLKLKYSTLAIATAETVIAILAVMSFFLASSSYAGTVLFFSLIIGPLQLRSIVPVDNPGNFRRMLSDIIKRPCTLLLIVLTAVTHGETWYFAILAALCMLSLVFSFAFVSFVLFKRNLAVLESSIAALLGTGLIALGIIDSDFFGGFFWGKYLPSGWIDSVAAGDLMAAALVLVLSAWLIRMRYRSQISR